MLDKIVLKGPKMQMTDKEFFNFCQDNRDLNIERNAQREIIIMSPTTSSTGFINTKILYQLEAWNQNHQRGLVFDSSTGFTLPDGSMRSPDASWLSLAKWQQLTDTEKEQFAPVCPEFVVELMSKSDRLTDLQGKMESWRENGAQLGWLIVPEEQTVYIYQPEELVRQHQDFARPLSADPVLPGFSLDFSKLKLP